MIEICSLEGNIQCWRNFLSDMNSCFIQYNAPLGHHVNVLEKKIFFRKMLFCELSFLAESPNFSDKPFFGIGKRQCSTCLYLSCSLHLAFSYRRKLTILERNRFLNQTSQNLAIVAFPLDLVYIFGRNSGFCKCNMKKSQV